ncbi:MAG TPA: signal peptidase II [Candidatus Acidoferrum sp.]|nr:signal peptidase II [Candidatus Acidoferrum sp.]
MNAVRPLWPKSKALSLDFFFAAMRRLRLWRHRLQSGLQRCVHTLPYFLGFLNLLFLQIQMIHANRLRWLILTLMVVFLDRLSKAAIEAKTAEGWHHELIRNFIYLVHSKNPGIAFSIFADSNSHWVRYLLIAGSLVVIAIIAWYLVAADGVSSRAAAGLALLLGGATGNLTDRVLHGAVTDFFEVLFGSYRYPAFNVADSAITIGAILILLDVLFSKPSRPNAISKAR